jgi:hypothetical protein
VTTDTRQALLEIACALADVTCSLTDLLEQVTEEAEKQEPEPQPAILRFSEWLRSNPGPMDNPTAGPTDTGGDE